MYFDKQPLINLAKRIHRIADLPVGTVALVAFHSLSPVGKALLSEQIVDNVVRLAALSALRAELEERSLDEPVPHGYKAMEHDGHCHWVRDPQDDEIDILGPAMQFYRTKMKVAMESAALMATLAKMLKVDDEASEPAEGIGEPYTDEEVADLESLDLNYMEPDSQDDPLRGYGAARREPNWTAIRGEGYAGD